MKKKSGLVFDVRLLTRRTVGASNQIQWVGENDFTAWRFSCIADVLAFGQSVQSGGQEGRPVRYRIELPGSATESAWETETRATALLIPL